MAKVEISKKACTVNPLKMSQPIGGALAFMGVKGCMPLLHGSQGCTSFGLVLFVRHFREAIPMQTTAMSEVATVLGGFENVEQAVITIANRAKPAMIGICSTGVTEIKGDDVDGFISLIRQNRPELNHLPLVYASTPDFKDAFQEGWARAVTRMVETLVETPAKPAFPGRTVQQRPLSPSAFACECGHLKTQARQGELAGEGQGEGGLATGTALEKTPSPQPSPGKLALASLHSQVAASASGCSWEREPPALDRNRVNILPGSHLTPGDVEELRDIVEAFGLEPSFLPDLSGSLDGHIPDDFTPTTIGGISVEEIAGMGRASWTVAIGEQMREAAEAMEKKTGVPFRLFDRLTGLAPNDAFVGFLAKISGRPVPGKLRRQRSQLLDAMLDGHFSFGGKKIAVGAEPDLLFSVSSWLAEMGCTVEAAVNDHAIADARKSASGRGADRRPRRPRKPQPGLRPDRHPQPRQANVGAARHPAVPLWAAHFDRLGAAHRLSVGYRGTRSLIFEIGNMFMAQGHEPTPADWRLPRGDSHDGSALTAH